MIHTAVILAAGLGSRLKQYTTDMPKGFLEIDKEALIERSLRLLRNQGIDTVLIGTGYLSGFYENLKGSYAGLMTRRNDIFDQTSSFYTLYNMQELISDDFLLLESDLLYEERALVHLLSEATKDIILASGKTDSGDEVYIETDETGMLVNMSKKRNDLKSIAGELVGISKISLHTFQMLIEHFHSHMEETRKIDYETALTRLSQTFPIKVDVISDLAWTEIDTEDHLNRAKTLIYPRIKELEKNDRINKHANAN
ncbi:MAG: phosphocholine cytidylyltransferase family protein [Proteobacteria bacterium]|nr:phosphocholine cytidylyltransferase family protein [Pseudomonadota bacterium]